MMELIQTYAVALVVALLIGVVAAYWVFRAAPPGKPAALDAVPQAEALPSHPVQPDIGAFVPGVDLSVAEAERAPEPEAPAAAPVAEGPPDDLQTLKGVGGKFAARLGELGFTRFDQLAALGAADIARLDEQMGPFKGRLARDRVVEQAGFLARGDRAGFEAMFGKLGSGAGPTG